MYIKYITYKNILSNLLSNVSCLGSEFPKVEKFRFSANLPQMQLSLSK